MPKIVNSLKFVVRRSIKTTHYPLPTTHSKGFTMIELLIAISIMAILAGIGTYSYTNAQTKARDTKRKQDLAQTKAALELYFQDNNAYPPASTTTIPGTTGCDNTTSGSGSTFTVCPSDSGNNWIPDITNYIQKLPKDPRETAILTQLAGALPKFSFGQIQQGIKSSLASLLPKFGGKETKPQGQVAAATTAGPNTAASAANTGTGIDWTNPTNARVSDNVRATVTLAPGQAKSLTVTGFGFAIPSTAQILGITAQIEAYQTTSGGASSSSPVYIVKGGVNSTSKFWFPDMRSDTTKTIGGASDLWSNTWTPADINAANFGISLVPNVTGGDMTYYVDSVKISITYEPNPPQPNLYTNTLVTKTGSCTGTATSTFTSGQSLVVCANQGNNGTGNASNFYWRSYRALTSAPNSGTAYDSQSGPLTWTAGSAFTAITALNATAGSTGCTAAGGGNYTCTAYVFMDATGVVSETNEADNLVSVTYTVANLPNLYLTPNSLVLRRNATPANCSNGTIVTNGTTVNSGEVLEVCISGGNNGAVATGNYYISNFVNQPTQPAYGSPTWQTYGPFTQAIGGLPYSQLGSITANYSTCSTNCKAAVFIDDANSVGNSNLVTESSENDNFITSVLYNVTGPPNATLTAVPTGSTGTGSSTLTWTTTNNPTSCNGTSSPANATWDGTKAATGGSLLVSNIAITTVFTITCSKAGFTDAVSSATFTVTIPTPPSVNLTATPTVLIGSGSSTLVWTTDNTPDSCMGTSSPSNAAWNGSKANTGGSLMINNITVTTTFTITCSKATYPNAASIATVTVNASLSGNNTCTGLNNVYCFVVSTDRRSFTLWANLENLNDPEIYTKPGAKCTEIPPDAAKFNYCIKQD